MTGAEIIRHQSLVRRVPVPDHIYAYAARLVRKTRPGELDGAGLAEAAGLLGGRAAGGAVPDPGRQGPRGAARQLHGAARGRPGSRRCRCSRTAIITTFAAQAEGIDAKKIVRRLIEETDAEQRDRQH